MTTATHEHRYVDGGICEMCGQGMSLTMAMGWAETLLEEAIDTITNAHMPDDGEHELVQSVLIVLDSARQQLIEDLPLVHAAEPPEPEPERKYTCLEFAFLAGGDTCTIGRPFTDPHFHVHGEDGWDVV